MKAGASVVTYRPEQWSDTTWLNARLPADRDRGQSFVGERAGLRIAAFAVAPPIEAFDPPGLAIALHTAPGPPGDAAAREAVRLAALMAARMKRGPLYAWPHPAADSAAADQFARLGFETCNGYTTYQLDLVQSAPTIVQLIQQHGRALPSGLEIVPLHQAEPAAVLEVWERGLGSRGAMRDGQAERLAGRGRRPFDPELSRVCRRGDVVLGACLVGPPTDGLAQAEVMAVNPEAGTVAAMVMLLIRVGEAALARRVERIRWNGLDTARFAHRLARRLPAEPIARVLWMRRDP